MGEDIVKRRTFMQTMGAATGASLFGAFMPSRAQTQPGPAASPALADELVIANHILFDQGVVDAFGHISVRNDNNPQCFCWRATWRPDA